MQVTGLLHDDVGDTAILVLRLIVDAVTFIVAALGRAWRITTFGLIAGHDGQKGAQWPR
jgi:hypothetical protein